MASSSAAVDHKRARETSRANEPAREPATLASEEALLASAVRQ
jgi:hypothetical protein